MYKVIFLLAVLLANVTGWSDCGTRVQSVSFSGACRDFESLFGGYAGEGTATYCCNGPNGQETYNVTFKGTSTSGLYIAKAENMSPSTCMNGYYSGYINLLLTVCSTSCEADSVVGCPEGQTWDSENCQCKQVGPPTPPPEGCTYCEDYMGWAEEQSPIGGINMQVPYSRMFHCATCYKDDNGYIISAGDCQEVRNSPGTCQQNGDCPSNQICADSTGNDSPVECIASIGPNVWLRDIKTGNTFKCEADGDCARAKQLVATGECKNPYADKNKPNSSDSDNPDSSSSGENPNSSSAENPPESSGEFCDMCDKLERIAANTQATMNNTSDISQWTLETMNKTIDIDNHLVEMGVDVSHIRTSTEATATNTGSIDNKLNTTNSLLNDIKNKNWNPTINVNPEVSVTVDTSKAPSEILQLMKDGQPNQGDTAGSGAEIDGLLGKIDSLIGDGMPTMDSDSVSNAMKSLKNNGLGAIKDTIKNSAFSDSMDVWGNKITDNGYITGSGSDNCPEILTRTWQVRFPIGLGGADVNIGPLGVYLCKPVAGMGITFWALCRVILRAMVAIACMIWLYKSVLGIDGGSNEED